MKRDRTKRGLCLKCNERNQQSHGRDRNRIKIYKKYCNKCSLLKYRPKYKYRNYKEDKCSYCGFIAIHSCQLDVDHIDGNHNNNNLYNLQTLCANCHRLKSHLEQNK